MRQGEELALVADELPVAIWLGRVPTGEVVYTNAAFREVLGIDPPTGAARGAFVQPYGVHTPAGDPYPEEKMPFERVIAARATVVVDDLVIHRHDGRRVNLRVFAKPIFDAEGELTHVLEAFIDITREVEADRARAEGERRLARSQRLESIGQLVAGIAHDFNNLLTVTKLVVSRLRATERDGERRDALAQVDTVTDSAVALIKNLIGFARRGKRARTLVSVEDVVSSMADIARRTFDRQIAVRTELGADGGVVLGDRSQLEQVVMNLLLNARDAIGESGEVLLRTYARVVAPGESGGFTPGRLVILEVTDTGSGIDPALRDRVFEPYFTTKTWGPVKGTGLGLSTVHGIVHAHDGAIEIAENPPRGTTMRVALPSPADLADRAPSREDDGRAPSDPPSGAASANRGGGRLVLVVDDEPLVRASTAASLRALGYRVMQAEGGAAALEIFRAHADEIEAVVLDMMMPGLGGKAVYLAMRERRPDVRVLLITGCELNDEVRAMLDLGVRASLAKPYDDQQLAASLQKIGAL